MKKFKLSELTSSPDRYNEGEILIQGTVEGASVYPANSLFDIEF